jgi:8-oxo-dGTP diphosphatase
MHAGTMDTRRAGRQHIGVGVAALVFDAQGRMFLARRGPLASNEQGAWAEPGGEVEFGEPLVEAVCREVFEEFDMVIAPLEQLAAFDHLLPVGQEHWVSVAFLALHVSGVPGIMEPGKCSACGWFALDALPTPLTAICEAHVRVYLNKFGVGGLPREGALALAPAGMAVQGRPLALWNGGER